MSAPPKPWQLRRGPYAPGTTTGSGRENNGRYSPRHSPPVASSSAPNGQQQQQLGASRAFPPSNRPQQAPLPPPRGPSAYGGGEKGRNKGSNTVVPPFMAYKVVYSVLVIFCPHSKHEVRCCSIKLKGIMSLEQGLLSWTLHQSGMFSEYQLEGANAPTR